MVLHRDVSVIRGRSRALHLGPEIHVIEATVLLATCKFVPELTLPSLWVVIIEHVERLVPRRTDQIILFVAPVDQARDVLVLIFSHTHRPVLGPRGLVVIRLTEAFLFNTVLDV